MENDITVGSRPNGIAYDPDNKKMYVANDGSNTVSVINTSNNTLNTTITVGSHPDGVAYDPDNKKRM